MQWVTIQLGSREHYAVPIALQAEGRLERLLTDVWLGGKTAELIGPFAKSFAARRTNRLPDDKVSGNTAGRLCIDFAMKMRGAGLWQTILARNAWFGSWAASRLERCTAQAVFSYSYTAAQPFKAAEKSGMLRILDQVDGAWREEQVWRELSRPYHHLESTVDKAPPEYWKSWHHELELADVIVVNSGWSRQMIVEAGASNEKIVEVPLVYEPGGSMKHGARSVERGTGKRLKALFLGNVVLRKGVGQLFDAIKMLRSEPIEFVFAGPVGVRVPEDIAAMDNVRFVGPVSRAEVHRLYGEADVFLFPTLSDGFGLTQLEALGHGIPVIASTHCGRVIEDRINGLLLEEITPETIADALVLLCRDRPLLESLKSAAHVPDRFHPRHLGPSLLRLENNNK